MTLNVSVWHELVVRCAEQIWPFEFTGGRNGRTQRADATGGRNGGRNGARNGGPNGARNGERNGWTQRWTQRADATRFARACGNDYSVVVDIVTLEDISIAR